MAKVTIRIAIAPPQSSLEDGLAKIQAWIEGRGESEIGARVWSDRIDRIAVAQTSRSGNVLLFDSDDRRIGDEVRQLVDDHHEESKIQFTAATSERFAESY